MKTRLTGAAVGVRAQVTGLMPGGGKVPFRLPAGALDYLDRRQYVHNMEVHAHLSGTSKPLLEPRKVERWSVPHGNVGWDDRTPSSVYLGRSLKVDT